MIKQPRSKKQNKVKEFVYTRKKTFWYYLGFGGFISLFLGFALYFIFALSFNPHYQVKLYQLVILGFLFFLFFLFALFYLSRAKKNVFLDNRKYLNNLVKIVNAHRGTLLAFNDLGKIFWTNDKKFLNSYFTVKKVNQTPHLRDFFSSEITKKLQTESFSSPLAVNLFNFSKNANEEFFLSKITTNLLLLHYNSDFLSQQFIEEESVIFFLLEVKPHSLSKRKKDFSQYQEQIFAYIHFYLKNFFLPAGFWTSQIKDDLFLILINFKFFAALKKTEFFFIDDLFTKIKEKWNINVDIKGGVYHHQPITFNQQKKINFHSNFFAKSYQNAYRALKIVSQNPSFKIAIAEKKNLFFFKKVAQLPLAKKANMTLFFHQKKQEFFQKITNYSKIIILGHKKADFDVFASAIALKIYLQNFFPQKLIAFVASDVDEKTRAEVDKVLTFQYDKYVTSSLDLFSKIDQSGEKTAIILLDTNDIKMVDSFLTKLDQQTIDFFLIDHHIDGKKITNPSFKLIYNHVSSTVELLFYLFSWKKENGFFPTFIWQLLTMGILLDTNNLQINLGEKTIELINFFTQKGVNLEKNIATINSYKIQFLAEKIEKIVVSPKKIIFKVLDVDSNSMMASSLADDFISKNLVDVVFVVVSNKKREIFLSARSKTDFDVQKICYQLGGGGDRQRAAAQFSTANIIILIKKIKKMIISQESR